MLVEINKVTEPHALDADYAAQVLMGAIHALDHKHGYVKKSELFESCINRISCHVTYHAVQEIQKKIQTNAGPTQESSGHKVPEEELDVQN